MAIDEGQWEPETRVHSRPGAGEPRAGTSGRSSGGRFRMTRPAAGLLGFALAAALFGAWLWISTTSGAAPSVDLTIVPTPVADRATSLPEDAAFDIFRDPGEEIVILPWWLTEDFPVQHVARLVAADGTIPGASIYAAISRETVACLVVRLEPNGLNWNCTSTEHVRLSGMTMHTAIPANLGSRQDGDGDGVSGDWSETDRLTIEWHVDGTFVVTR
ncbi:hypothetical protein [Agromyces bauzanensis]